MKVGTNAILLVFLQESLAHTERSLDVHAQSRDLVRGGRRAAICKPRIESSPEVNPVGILILDSQLPELWDNKCLLLKPLSLWFLLWCPQQ